MITSLALIILLGLFFNKFFTFLKLPGLLGMILLGILMGPYGFNILDPQILNISGDLRKIALIVILLRAGFGINKNALNAIGVDALKISSIPGVLEGFTIMFISYFILDFSLIQGGMLGFILAAVSPAVIVPQMLNYIDRGIGKTRNVPTLVLAGASIDDVFAITLFNSFLALYFNKGQNFLLSFASIPISVILGILFGAFIGIILSIYFKKYSVRDTKKVLIILGISILLTTLETELKNVVEIASLIGVMTIGFVLLEKLPEAGKRLSVKFNKIWVLAEIFLFVLVGAQVNIYLIKDAGTAGLLIIALGLVGRTAGVFLSLLGTKYTKQERFFCALSYIPKATVQAAIGSIPLTMGIPGGDIILAIAVLSIVITAPTGAIGLSIFGEKLLKN